MAAVAPPPPDADQARLACSFVGTTAADRSERYIQCVSYVLARAREDGFNSVLAYIAAVAAVGPR